MTIATRPADTIAAIAARVFPGADVRRFTEILDQNPDLDVFADLTEGLNLNLPSTEQIESFARPALTQIADSLGGARGFLGQATDTITQISGQLPPEFQGYAQEALDLVGEANGVLDQAETLVDQADEKLREYSGGGTNLVSWLLSGRA